MRITIDFGLGTVEATVSSSFDKELSMNDEETQAFEIFKSLLSDSVDMSKITIERRSYDYLSVFFGKNDFLRFRFSPRTKWLSIRLAFPDRAPNMENPLFAAQKNKKQSHWKSKVDSLDDLPKYKDFLVAACIDY